MEEADRKLYENLLDLFTHEGWKIFVDLAKQDLIRAKESALESDSFEKFCEYRGAIKILNWVIGFEATVRAVLDQADQDEDAGNILES